MKKTLIIAGAIASSLVGMSFMTNSDVRTYKSATIESVYKTSISELTTEEKQEAFEYFAATGSCSFKGIELKGKVQFVTSYPDIKIQYVTSYPDIKVKEVSSYPDDCGEWQTVTSYPDFKVQVVTSYPDLKVQKVTSYPGMN
jgi:hypothetical protein